MADFNPWYFILETHILPVTTHYYGTSKPTLKNGTSTVVMPSEVFVHMSKLDLTALISYLKQLPPVNLQLPTTKFYYMGRTLLAMGKLNILVAEKRNNSPSRILLNPVLVLRMGATSPI
ncbi:hypothetical protein AHMF7605_06990 [Adhaeribacter arboris]|uniref:Uncharacterized protein n=1 Tax=Adhaeribacter arboris TaxID=2072846 RepID=A0A2T2YCR7_9BACT|nr:hypothetical protein [Adhaeribacter arboris]PSR53294.1 hypothetical protein AHMF7605_06990 [Adhaeribacter arboris]